MMYRVNSYCTTEIVNIVIMLGIFDFSFEGQGSFNIYVDRILPFDLPPCVDSFYILSVYKKRDIF